MDADNRLQRSHGATPNYSIKPQKSERKPRKQGEKNITPFRDNKNILVGHERSAKKTSTQKPSGDVRHPEGTKAHQIKKESASFGARLQNSIAAIKSWVKNVFHNVQGKQQESEPTNVKSAKTEHKKKIKASTSDKAPPIDVEGRQANRKKELEAFRSEIKSLGERGASAQVLGGYTQDLLVSAMKFCAHHPPRRIEENQRNN